MIVVIGIISTHSNHMGGVGGLVHSNGDCDRALRVHGILEHPHMGHVHTQFAPHTHLLKLTHR